MKPWKLPRRDMLKALGLGAGMLPLLDGTPSFGAAVYPKRLIILTKGNGTILEEFWPKGDGEDLTKKPLGAITAPLEPFKPYLIFPDGINLRNWMEGNPYGSNGNAHHNFGAILTGTYIISSYESGAPAGSESVDNYIANALAAKGVQAPVKLLVSSGQKSTDSNGYCTVSWRGRAASNTPESSPYKVFNRLFMGRSLTGGGTDASIEALIKERRSLLDFIGKDVESFGKNFGGDDRLKIEAHLQALRERQKELASAMPGQLGACKATALEPNVALTSPNQGKLPKMHLDLIVDAMRCDITRVATLVMSDSNQYDLFYEWLGDGFGKGLSTVSEFPERHGHSIAHGAYGKARALKLKVEAWYQQQLAYLLKRLQETPEGGGTMLDNTLVLFVDTLNNPGGHSVTRMPWIIAAGRNVGFKTGRHLKYNGAAQNGLLYALCTAMDVAPAAGTFGDPKWGKGELAGLRG